MRHRIGIALGVLIAVSAVSSAAFADDCGMSPTGDLKIPNKEITSNVKLRVARIEEGVQTIITPLESGKYLPFVVQKGIPVRWVIRASVDDLNSCNNQVTVPTYGIRKQLLPGDNVIEFTPDREGTIRYACRMGMISSTIRVVADLAQERQNSPEGVR